MKLMVTLLVRRLRIERIVSAKARLMHLRVRSSEIGNKGRVVKALLKFFPAQANRIYLKYHQCTL